MAVAAYRQAEYEFYYEEYEDCDEDEREYDDEQIASMYDEEQCAYYYQDYIEERNRDIRKQLYLRSQPAKTLQHDRLEKKMQLRRERREEQATEVQITTTETEQQQKQKNKDDKKRKKTTKPNHTTGWIRGRLTLLTKFDGTGRHERLSKMA
jgi:hypothetical protein